MACMQYNANMIRTQIQFNKKTYESLKTKSKETGKSISEIVPQVPRSDDRIARVRSEMGPCLELVGQVFQWSEQSRRKHDEHLGDRW